MSKVRPVPLSSTPFRAVTKSGVDALKSGDGLAQSGKRTPAIHPNGGWRPRPARLRVARQWFGGRYGRPTRAGDEAMRIAEEMGLELEPTYTAKAFAAALDQLGRGRRVAFIQTFAGTG